MMFRTFAEEVVSMRIPARIYRDGNNSTKDMDGKEWVRARREYGDEFAYFNGEWYDVTDYIRRAADEIGNVGRVDNKEHSDICDKYVNQFVQDALAGRVEPVDVERLSKTKKTAEV